MHPIYFLWTHPRSCSTAFERIIINRGDLFVFHEPFSYLYYSEKGNKTTFMHLDENHPTKLEDIVNMILEKANEKPVFIKDMAYYFDIADLQNPVLQNLFKSSQHSVLVRATQPSIISHHKLNPNVTLRELGYEHLWLMYVFLKYGMELPVHLMSSEKLQDDCETEMENWCNSNQLKFDKSCLQWEKDQQIKEFGNSVIPHILNLTFTRHLERMA